MANHTRRGRPRIPAAAKRKPRVSLKLTDAEYAALKRAARQAGMSMSDLLVWRTIGARTPAREGKSPT